MNLVLGLLAMIHFNTLECTEKKWKFNLKSKPIMLRIRGKSMGFFLIKNITAAHVILDHK